MTQQLNDVEKKVLGELLDRLSDAMGSAGCNEFHMPDNKKFRKAVNDFAKQDDPDHGPAQDIESDFIVLGYLRERLGV